MGAFLRLMVSKQKPAVSSCASSAQSCTDHPVSQPQHHLAPPSLGGPDPTCCIVHRLEEAIELTVALHAELEGKVCHSVSDNGVGLLAGLDWQQSTSLGLQLVQMLTGQLDGTMEMHHHGGTE